MSHTTKTIIFIQLKQTIIKKKKRLTFFNDKFILLVLCHRRISLYNKFSCKRYSEFNTELKNKKNLKKTVEYV